MTEPSRELARANAMLDLKRYDNAASLLARLVAAEPDSSRTWCLLARAHLGTGQYQEAAAAANRAVALAPSDEWPHRLASNALMHAENYPEALRAANEARRLAPDRWQTHICVAQAALAARMLDIAAQATATARGIAPNEPDVHFLSGKVSLARGDLAAAREHQEHTLALDPAHSGAMNELGRIKLRAQDAMGAIRHFIRAARSAPGESVYSHNVNVVILRTLTRMLYLVSLVAVVFIFVPAAADLARLSFAATLPVAACLLAALCALLVVRMPPEARRLLWRALHRRRVAAAVAVALGGIAVAFTVVGLAPENMLSSMMLVGAVLVMGSRLLAFAILRGVARKPPGQISR
jgi:tetratricopeptide (TPR) repeat protein